MTKISSALTFGFLKAWYGMMALLLASQHFFHAEAADAAHIQIDANTVRGEVYNFWSTSPMPWHTRFADRKEHAALRREYPLTQYVNCVRLLGGRSDGKNLLFKGVGPNGEAICDFTEAKQAIRGILKCRFTPRIVLDNVPIEMSKTNLLHGYGNTQPPENYETWTSFIRQFVEMLVIEFGREEVSKWRFRVGTEPDLNPDHWSGTKEEYLKHYDFTVDAVTCVIPNADIGPGNILNPAQRPPNPKKGWWGLDLIDHCATGTNYKTGKIGTRMCFFSCSWYGKVGKDIASFDVAIDRIRERLTKYPQFATVPVEVHEFSVLHDEQGRFLHAGDATEWAASWMAAIADKVYEKNVAQVYQWVITYDGSLQPRTHVLGLLEKMQNGKRFFVNTTAPGKIGCVASEKNGGLDLLIYRHRTERDDGNSASVRFALSGKRIAKKSWRVKRAKIIDHDHSNYIHQFCADANAAGIQPLTDAAVFPVNLNRRFGEAGAEFFAKHKRKYERLGELKSLAPVPKLIREDNESLTFSLNLSGHSVVYLRLE